MLGSSSYENFGWKYVTCLCCNSLSRSDFLEAYYPFLTVELTFMYHLKPICLLYNPPDSHISSERHHHAASFVSNCMSCYLVKPAQAQCVHCTSSQEHFGAPCVTQETWSLEESRFPAKYISALCGIFCIVILIVSAQPDPRGRVGAVEKSAGFKSFSAQLTSGVPPSTESELHSCDNNQRQSANHVIH